MQLEQVPEEVRAELCQPSSEEAQAQAMAEYRSRFVTARLDASCLNVASSGQSATVNNALTGGNPFEVCCCLKQHWHDQSVNTSHLYINEAEILGSRDAPSMHRALCQMHV